METMVFQVWNESEDSVKEEIGEVKSAICIVFLIFGTDKSLKVQLPMWTHGPHLNEEIISEVGN